MNALDLYCGGGGAAMGLFNAGFKDITGIDINKQKDYPFRMIQGDVLKLPSWWIKQFDFVWASPPCQAYTLGTKWARMNGKSYPDLIEPTRELLLDSKIPYCIENVPYAPIRHDLMLCGEMFNLRTIRHRFFEIEGFHVMPLIHRKHKLHRANGSAVAVYGRGISPNSWTFKGKRGKRWQQYYSRVYGNGGDRFSRSKLSDWKEAMGIDWITTKKMLAEAVPPKYSEYIGKHIIKPVPTLM